VPVDEVVALRRHDDCPPTLSKLEEAGLVQIQKRFMGKVPNTQVSLTRAGRDSIERHWRQLESLHRDVQQWQAPTTRDAVLCPAQE
jgi:DNA-binding PadR family transcriptional regulator